MPKEVVDVCTATVTGETKIYEKSAPFSPLPESSTYLKLSSTLSLTALLGCQCETHWANKDCITDEGGTCSLTSLKSLKDSEGLQRQEEIFRDDGVLLSWSTLTFPVYPAGNKGLNSAFAQSSEY